MKLRQCLVLALLAFSLAGIAGCDQKSLVEKFASPQEQELALSYIAMLRAGKLAEIENSADPSTASPDLPGTLKRMAELVPAGEPISRTLVGAHTFFGPSGKDTNLTFQYQFDRSWVLINVVTRLQGDRLTLIGMQVQPIESSLQELNAFSFHNKSALHYLVLAVSALNVVLTVLALVLVFRNKQLSRKWAWYLFVLVGFGQLDLNWTTGDWGFKPLAVMMFSAAVFAAPFGPWVVSASLPLGAVIVILGSLLPPIESQGPAGQTAGRGNEKDVN